MSETGDAPLPRGPGVPTASPPGRHRDAAAVFEVCPYLRAASGSWRSAYASRDHRCAAVQPAAQLAIAKQRSLCLVAGHESCATYLAARQPAGVVASSGDDAGSVLWPAVRSTPTLLEPTRGLRTPLPVGSTRAGGQVLLVVLMVVAFAVLVIARTTSPAGSGSPAPGASAGAFDGGSSSPGAAPTSAVPSLVPSSSPGPTGAPSPTVAATPAATLAPTPLPSGSQTYTVKANDTLSGIAARFGTTVAALAAANNIADPSLIRIGQVLIIP